MPRTARQQADTPGNRGETARRAPQKSLKQRGTIPLQRSRAMVEIQRTRARPVAKGPCRWSRAKGIRASLEGVVRSKLPLRKLPGANVFLGGHLSCVLSKVAVL